MSPVVVQIIISILMGLGAAELTGVGAGLGLGLGLADDVLFWFITQGWGYTQKFAFAVMLDEIEKITAELAEEHSEDDDEYARRTRILARQNPNTVYVFGEISVEDFALLGGGAALTFQPELLDVPFQVAAGFDPRADGLLGGRRCVTWWGKSWPLLCWPKRLW